jgi:hypothetical protein
MFLFCNNEQHRERPRNYVLEINKYENMQDIFLVWPSERQAKEWHLTYWFLRDLVLQDYFGE